MAIALVQTNALVQLDGLEEIVKFQCATVMLQMIPLILAVVVSMATVLHLTLVFVILVILV